MDQDAFRQLVSTSKTTSSVSKPSFSASRNVLGSGKAFSGKKALGQKAAKEKEKEDVATLKPRKLKSAAAPVEKTQLHSLLRDLTGHEVDDDSHPGSLRGLDLSLVARARSEAAKVDDAADEDALEAAFASNASGSVQPSPLPTEKKTRAEILAQLKASRSAGGTTETTTGEPVQSKFKPIGFKPVESARTKKKKKADGALDGERKKKKRKAEGTVDASSSAAATTSIVSAPIVPLGPASHTPTPLEDVIDDDDDIFADAGEYRGIDLGESDDEDGKRPSTAHRDESGATSSDAPARRGWFGDDPTATEEATVDVNRSPTPSTDSAQGPTSRVPEDEEEEARLRPLASSTVPSIRAMLAADDALAAEEKRKARKEKRKKAA